MATSPSTATAPNASVMPNAERLLAQHPAGRYRAPRRARHHGVDVGVEPHVERARRPGADRDAQQRREAQHRMQMAGRHHEADQRREHHERHHPRLHQRHVVADRGLADGEDDGLRGVIDGGDICHALSMRRPALGVLAFADRKPTRPRPHRRNCAQAPSHLIRGSTLNWWNGGGEDSVHSSVVAPGPHGLSAARSLRMKARTMPKKKISTPTPEM